MKRSDHTTENGSQNLHIRQSPLQQSPNGLRLGLQPVEVHFSHTVPPVGMADMAATHECGEWRVGVVPH
jgi:hypothetical protein